MLKGCWRYVDDYWRGWDFDMRGNVDCRVDDDEANIRDVEHVSEMIKRRCIAARREVD